MTDQAPTDPTIIVHPDGSITFKEPDLRIITSALLWARIGAERMTLETEALATADSLAPEARVVQARNSRYHAERACWIKDLETRIGRANARTGTITA